MALGASYATTAELKTRIGESSATFDTVLGEALSTASRWIEKYCGRQFNAAGSATARVYYPQSRLVATVEDISTTTGLVIKTDDGNDGTYETTWASTDYQLEPLNGVVDGETGWPYYRIRAVGSYEFPCSRADELAPLQVTANWGWSAVPAAVKEACLMLAEETYKLREAPFGVAGYGQYGAIRVRMNPRATDLLGPYRHNPVMVG